MKISRRSYLGRSALLAGGAAAFGRLGALLGGEVQASGRSDAPPRRARGARYTPVVTPNGSTLPFELKNGVKEFHLVAEPVKREFAPGFVVNCWGYNGETPGPTIEAVEGDRVRILVSNHQEFAWSGNHVDPDRAVQ